LLASTALLLIARAAGARTWAGGTGMPWRPFAGDPPQAVKPGPWVFFTPEEAAAVEALVDRLIPPDPETPGGKVDTQGREWEQPAEMVFLCAFQMFNVQLLLLSGIGQPYDVNTGQGVIGVHRRLQR
jgi:hypothetical protein